MIDPLRASTTAAAASIPKSVNVYNSGELEALIRTLYEQVGPVLAMIKLMTAQAPTALPPRDGPYLKNRFRQSLVGDNAAE